MQDLDRVLDRDDVLPPCAVDVAEHRRERRRLAGAGSARDEDESAVLLGEPRDPRGQLQSLEAGTSRGITRNANEMSPRWRNALTLKRGNPGR